MLKRAVDNITRYEPDVVWDDSPAVHLFDRIAESVLTMVIAPAGFGKSAAIGVWSRRFAERGRPVIRVDGRSCLAPPTGSDRPIGRRDVAPAEAGRAAIEHIRQQLAAAGARHAMPVLIVDDAHLVSSAILSLVAALIEAQDAGLRLIVSARRDVRLPLARLRAAGRLVEIGPAQLRLTAAGTARLLARHLETPVDVAWSDQVYAATRGWAAGVALAARAAAARSSLESFDRPSTACSWERSVMQYFEEEVLEQIEPPLLEMLRQLAIVPGFDMSLARAITGLPEVDAAIGQIAAAGLFMSDDDGTSHRFRLDPLFRKALLARRGAAEPIAMLLLYRRAIEHLEGAGDTLAAVETAAASGDPSLLGPVLERTGEALCYAGAMERVVALAGALDDAALGQLPNLLLCLAWRRIRALDIAAAERLIDRAERAAGAIATGGEADGGRLDLLIRHRRALLLGARDDIPAAIQVAEEMLAELGDDHPYLRCTMLAQLMAGRRELFRFPDALRLEADLRRAVGRPGSRFAAISLQTSAAPTLALQGRTAVARALLEQALALAEQFGGAGSALASLPGLPLAELCYDLGDLDRARALLDACLPKARAFLNLDQLCSGHLVHARILATDGHVASALAALDEAHLVALECGLPRMRSLAMSMQVELLLRDGRVDAAERAYRSIGLDPAHEPVPTLHPTRCQEAAALAWLRLQLRRLRPVRARMVARRWRDTVWRANSLRSVVQFDLILAQAASLEGKVQHARRHLREALTNAAEPGWRRLFVDEGEVLLTLLRDGYAGEAGGGPADLLALDVLAEAGWVEPQPQEIGVGDRLAPREAEILVLVGHGLHNREIGGRLGLTEGTVKWYMQQVYDKLGVRRRPQAVTRARMLGLIT